MIGNTVIYVFFRIVNPCLILDLAQFLWKSALGGEGILVRFAQLILLVLRYGFL
jgi:hypothetical protein